MDGNWRNAIWSGFIVSLVTVLIWLWAAGETRERKTFNFVRLQYTVADPTNWVVAPAQQPLTLVVEGSAFVLQNAESLFRRPFKLNLTSERGRQNLDVVEHLSNLDHIKDLGIQLISSEPQTVDVELDEFVRSTVAVKPLLPGVTTEGEVVMEPSEVTLAVPSQVLTRYPRGITVEAAVERFELDNLAPGEQHQIEVKLRPKEALSPLDFTLTPSKARISFTIRSRTREIRLERVTVQLVVPPSTLGTHQVELETGELDDITISADADIVRRIENDEIKVVAMLHLSEGEVRSRLDSKAVSYFVALIPDGNGGTRGEQVMLEPGDAQRQHLVQLRITELPER